MVQCIVSCFSVYNVYGLYILYLWKLFLYVLKTILLKTNIIIAKSSADLI